MFKNAILFLTKLAVSVGVIYLLLQKVDVSQVYNLLRIINIQYLFGAGLCVVLSQIFFTKRWQNIIKINASNLSFGQLFKQVYIGFFMGQGLPSIVGGDVFRAVMLKDAGVPLMWGTQTLIIDRLCGMLALTFLSLIFLPLEFSVIANSKIGIILLAVILMLVGCFLGIILFHKMPFLKIKMLNYFENLSLTFFNFFKSQNFLPTFCWAVLGMLFHLLSMFFLAQGLGLPLMLSQIVTGSAVILLITALPISFAGWGLREGAMVLTFSVFGVAATEAVSLSLLLGGVQLIASLPGLVLWIFYKRSKNDQGFLNDLSTHQKA